MRFLPSLGGGGFFLPFHLLLLKLSQGSNPLPSLWASVSALIYSYPLGGVSKEQQTDKGRKKERKERRESNLNSDPDPNLNATLHTHVSLSEYLSISGMCISCLSNTWDPDRGQLQGFLLSFGAYSFALVRGVTGHHDKSAPPASFLWNLNFSSYDWVMSALLPAGFESYLIVGYIIYDCVAGFGKLSGCH